jgi:hypothetical protein
MEGPSKGALLTNKKERKKERKKEINTNASRGSITKSIQIIVPGEKERISNE